MCVCVCTPENVRQITRDQRATAAILYGMERYYSTLGAEYMGELYRMCAYGLAIKSIVLL